MPDSPDLWDAFRAAIEAGGSPPADVNGDPILDQPAPNGGQWPRTYRGKTSPLFIQEDGVEKTVLPPPGYILLGQEFENEAGCYNGEAGQDGLYRGGCWGRTPDDAKKLYRWYKPLVHNVPLAVAGYQPVAGILEKSGPTPDPDGTAWQVEWTYRAEPFEA